VGKFPFFHCGRRLRLHRAQIVSVPRVPSM
jgi:hypothetical protein